MKKHNAWAAFKNLLTRGFVIPFHSLTRFPRPATTVGIIPASSEDPVVRLVYVDLSTEGAHFPVI